MPAPLSAECRRELKQLSAVLPLLVTHLNAPWSEAVHAYDASPWGTGVCARELPSREIAEIGGCRGVWRFRHPSAGHARAQALGFGSVTKPDRVESSGDETTPTTTASTTTFDRDSPTDVSGHDVSDHSHVDSGRVCDSRTTDVQRDTTCDANHEDVDPSQSFSEIPSHIMMPEGWRCVPAGRIRQRESTSLVRRAVRSPGLSVMCFGARGGSASAISSWGITWC